jgi:diphthine synthase
LLSSEDLSVIEQILGRTVKLVARWFVEDGREIIEQAKSQKIAIVTYGDPLIATTHNELRARAAGNSIPTSVIHSSSGIFSVMGEAGLHVYKFGRMVTIMSEPQSAVSVYNTIFENLLSHSHTMILTEYRFDGSGEPFFLDPVEVFKMLLAVESDQKQAAFSGETFAVVASRVGQKDQQIISGKVGSLQALTFGPGPHTIIIPGTLHFTESEALGSFTQVIDPPSDNSDRVIQISARMVEQYAPKARAAVQQMREYLKGEKDATVHKGLSEVLDNAEYYIIDARRFMNQGKHELAVLSIGYAEGLVDALRFQMGINPWLPSG